MYYNIYVCVCVSWSGTTSENLNKLIQHVKIEHESGYILNWKHLGVPIVSTVSMQMLFSLLALLLFQLVLHNSLIVMTYLFLICFELHFCSLEHI